jgi:hypothetical protein
MVGSQVMPERAFPGELIIQGKGMAAGISVFVLEILVIWIDPAGKRSSDCEVYQIIRKICLFASVLDGKRNMNNKEKSGTTKRLKGTKDFMD